MRSVEVGYGVRFEGMRELIREWKMQYQAMILKGIATYR